MSTRWQMQPASPTSSSVARKDVTSSTGSFLMKRTVSVRKKNAPSEKETRRRRGSRVEKRLGDVYRRSSARRLNSVDFPALVYPTRETVGTGLCFRLCRWLDRLF